ncbi:ATP-binding SpoIIE family protein phosphatase [Oceanicoccus sagamiensis]|uniref:Fused response regulator/phosphatase n=1 Tax=Oceanicoccus sagamiensis TaxID=716816 RepID=A0A1X9NHV2_9GAMM|nr:fused response regulator/phosphatase [Oceanicoccus sagamiensis]ARN75415.1 fused response regulator/phosphatase [Oceanicoccus sagamiensis]
MKTPVMPAEEAPPLAKAKILIADDSDTDRLVLQTILKKQGHDVVVASDGIEAIDVFKQEWPGIVLLDALMPRMDGFEAAEIIKQLAGEEFIPLIFLTSLQEADSLARCLDAGGDDFLSKPYNSVILKAKINAFERMREMHHTLAHQRDEIYAHNNRLLREQEVAKRVFDKVAHAGCLDASNIQYALSPIAVFNGDVALAGVNPAGDLMVLLGDFTGHGLDAAIGAMPLAQSFYSMLEKGFSMQNILREINLKLHEILPVGVFCCALVAEIDFKNRTVRTWNGGLPDCVIYRPRTQELLRLVSRHVPLGIKANVDFSDAVETYEVEPGDRLYLWSDGIHEAANERDEMFGEQRLHEVFSRNQEPEKLFHEVNIAVNSFISEDSVGDDISLVEVEIVAPEDFNVDQPQFIGGQQAGPKDWSLQYELRPETLRDFDPLPMLLHVLMHVPFLRSFGGQIYTAMTELYTNALEHGVLKLASELKNSPEGFAGYYQEREKRLQQLDQGWVVMALDYKGTMTGGRLSVTVEDSGDGFDYHGLLAGNGSGQGYSGRGITLLQSICHSVEYLGSGNKVRVVFVWGDQ